MLENLLVSPLVLGLLALRRLLALLGVLWLLSRVLPPNVLLSTVVLLAVLRRLFLLLPRLFLLFSVCFFTRTFLADRFECEGNNIFTPILFLFILRIYSADDADGRRCLWQWTFIPY